MSHLDIKYDPITSAYTLREGILAARNFGGFGGFTKNPPNILPANNEVFLQSPKFLPANFDFFRKPPNLIPPN